MRWPSIKMWQRFYNKVDKTKGPNSCWTWKARTDVNGYGRFVRNSKKRAELAHRVSFELAYGIQDPVLHICHKCDNPRCVNPVHLFPGTAKDNVHDCIKKGRRRNPRGSKIGISKLTENNVQVMREMRRAGMSMRSIGRLFKVSSMTSRYAILGKTWGHVT